MKHRSIDTASCNGVECNAVCTISLDAILEVCLCLILHLAWGQICHQILQTLVGQLDCLTDQGNLILILLHSHLSDDRSAILYAHTRVLLCKLTRLHHVVILKIIYIVTVSIKIYCIDILSCHHTIKHTLLGIDKSNLPDLCLRLCLAGGHLLSHPTLAVWISLLNKKRLCRLLCRIIQN